jgi:hypothetical protein
MTNLQTYTNKYNPYSKKIYWPCLSIDIFSFTLRLLNKNE